MECAQTVTFVFVPPEASILGVFFSQWACWGYFVLQPMSQDLHAESHLAIVLPPQPDKDNYSTAKWPMIEAEYKATKAKAVSAQNHWVEREQVAKALKCIKAEKAEAECMKKQQETDNCWHDKAKKITRGATEVLALEPCACT